jgi:hypothetical protein
MHRSSGDVNDKVGRTWEETALAYFKMLFHNSSGGTEENHKILIQES